MKRMFFAAWILCFFLANYSPSDPNEKFIQGKWDAAGDLGDGHSWYLEWTFARGKFEMSGYPPLYQSGKYRVTASEGSTLTLELFDQSGDLPTDDRTITILVDPNSETVTIDGQGPFSRMSP